ncbi:MULTISPECIES: glycosyltransferase family 2 protein [unclassified Acinetobacter]|uniref:glycosyltransferase family 2 protein n=1 Tax=unclassified Acinetobacter TaxID=196816 RepID=UPI0025776CD6|nr:MULTISPECIES: glycosyltransferase family 2 protein [unclassified Acinetobacter]MDM1757792.1 glycosyltransferase family 2 protein [Acinetobacter sp. 256-1]MDM1761888.1 glycosyltransferase family 2 protein [Acinetobacter sp. 251-1]
MATVSISVVLTHFNKGPLLQRTIESLQPDLPELLEIIVADDASTDPNWRNFSQQLEQQYPKVKIIHNIDNKGPANRLNQGANAAQGDYLFFMDADDVLAPNRLKQIVELMQAQNCDLFYGNKVKIRDLAEIQQYPTMDTSSIEQPLTYMIQHNIMEMCVMCSKEVWQKSQGCNSNLFIQDESLALELGVVAQKLLFTETATVFVILDAEETKTKRGDNRLSQNLNQQHYDMFFTIYDFLNTHDLNQTQQNLLKKKALSTYWKSLKSRDQKSLKEFFYYALAKRNPQKWWSSRAEQLKSYFSQLDHVRKPRA